MKRREIHKQAFLLVSAVSTLLFAAAVAGVALISPTQLRTLNVALQYYVCGFLVIRFNPFLQLGTSDPAFERKVAFSAGIFLLLSTTATSSLVGVLLPGAPRNSVCLP